MKPFRFAAPPRQIDRNHFSGRWGVGRRRIEGMQLPEGIQVVRKPSGKTYYYWAPNRGTKAAGERVSLGSDLLAPDFWKTYHQLSGTTGRDGTFERLAADFKASPEWERLRPATKRDYASYLDRIVASAGDRLVCAVTRRDIYAFRDAMGSTPVAANHMVSILKTILEWSVERGWREDNPAAGVKRLKSDEGGATPWPEDGYRFVLDNAPTDLRRMAFLGRATGQRAGDLVRMRPADLQGDGITVRIGKRREAEHFIPLTVAQMAEIRSWDVSPLDLFIKSNRNKPYSATHLNSRWNRWRESKEAAPILGLKMTIHGLRATKIDDLDAMGASDRQISAEVGLSTQMVSRYLRFANKARKARASRDRREQNAAAFENPVAALKTTSG